MVPPLEKLLRRDRAIVLAALTSLVVGAWIYMVHEARTMTVTGVCQCFGMKLAGSEPDRWRWTELLALFLMWTEMMVAMMVPTVAPTILTFAAVNRRRRELEQPYAPAGFFLVGYLLVWTAFSVAATAVQWALHSAELLSPAMRSNSPLVGGVLLASAGVFQWMPHKHDCLARCRNPLQFLMSEWRDGSRGAIWMGVRHGAYCTGCCWLLMALLFVLGVMNVWWVAIITAFVLVEKLAPRGLWVSRIAGFALAAWGVSWLVWAVVNAA